MAQSRRVSSYTMEYKLSVLKWYHENGENKHTASREFGIDRKCVREWLDSLLFNRVGLTNKKQKLNAGKDPLSVELDHAVLEYLLKERAAGRPVSYRDLSAKAIKLALEMTLPDSFKALAMWLKRWKRRSGGAESVSAVEPTTRIKYQKVTSPIRKTFTHKSFVHT